MKKGIKQVERRKQARELEDKWSMTAVGGWNITAMKDSIERIKGLSINRHTR